MLNLKSGGDRYIMFGIVLHHKVRGVSRSRGGGSRSGGGLFRHVALQS
jgi:hypothetical protein